VHAALAIVGSDGGRRGGVVDQDVHPAELLGDLRDRGPHGLIAGGVGG
jgi:hypothetical protein